MADPLSEQDVINIINNTFNDNADDWWENEVKPELEKINSTLQDILTQHTIVASEIKTIDSTLQDILTQHTIVASEIETIDTAIQKIRDLADHPNGPGIRTVSPYGYLGQAILYQLYVKQGQVLADAELDPAAQEESLNKINEIINELFSNLDPNQGGFG